MVYHDALPGSMALKEKDFLCTEGFCQLSKQQSVVCPGCLCGLQAWEAAGPVSARASTKRAYLEPLDVQK